MKRYSSRAKASDAFLYNSLKNRSTLLTGDHEYFKHNGGVAADTNWITSQQRSTRFSFCYLSALVSEC
jgi:hypothetical protein